VVAASVIYNYEAGMDTDAGLLTRIQTMPSSFRLVQQAHAVVREGRWALRIKPAPPETAPVAVVRPLAAGTKVVAGRDSETARMIASNCGDAQGVEMEGFGVLYAAYANKVDALVIRGISDLLEKNKMMPSRAATAMLLRPSAQASTIQARSASPCAVLRRSAQFSSVRRSAWDNTSGSSLVSPIPLADCRPRATSPPSRNLRLDATHVVTRNTRPGPRLRK
jgi:hypothetical protein